MEAPSSPLHADEAPACDAAMLAELEDIFGRARLAELLRGLRGEIRERLGPPAGEREQLGRDAHVLVSVSGLLGFTALSRACVELEGACLGTQDVAEPLSRVQAAAADALRAIATIRADLG